MYAPSFSGFLNEGPDGDEQPLGDASIVTRFFMFLCVLGGFWSGKKETLSMNWLLDTRNWEIMMWIEVDLIKLYERSFNVWKFGVLMTRG